MKKIFFCLSSFLFFSLVACAQQDLEAIQQTVTYWNDLHNSKSLDKFENLYAPDLLFYGKYRSKATCLKEKSVFYRLDGFHQDITSPIKVTFYSSGTIKSSFTKRVTYKQRVKEYDAYLLLVKKDGGYSITGESDLRTDKRWGVQLNLGAELDKGDQPMVLISFITLLGIAATGYLVIRKKSKEQRLKQNTIINEVQETIPALTAIPQPITSSITEKMGKEKVLQTSKAHLPLPTEVMEATDEQAKGRAFEEYVVQRFPDSYFKILEWRSDKFINGRYAESNKLPDLELLLETKTVQVPFAVECKWRKAFYQGGINWAKDYQVRNYKKYEYEKDIPVFVILGVGGEPSNPEAVYIVPLIQINTTVVSQHTLQPYYRHSKGNFFLNYSNMHLE